MKKAIFLLILACSLTSADVFIYSVLNTDQSRAEAINALKQDQKKGGYDAIVSFVFKKGVMEKSLPQLVELGVVVPQQLREKNKVHQMHSILEKSKSKNDQMMQKQKRKYKVMFAGFIQHPEQ